MKKYIAAVLVLASGGVAYAHYHKPKPTPQTHTIQTVQQASKTLCKSQNGLPDASCTPGVVLTTDKSKICVSGYTKTIRPPVSYTNPLKQEQMKQYGFTDSPQNYEEDHLISLELGGSPTDPKNLWPEPYNIQFGAHEKDHVENYLHKQVCAGRMSIQEAQQEISQNWIQVYTSVPNITNY